MRKILFVTFGFIAASIFGMIQPALTADALSGWKAGRIINDSVFTDYNSMSASQIQSFLNGKVTSCDTNGQKLSEFGGPDLNGDGKVQRWEWGKSKYNQTKFICIKDYVVDGKKASQIIYEKAQKYKISPRVLIVLLQKEQGLITDSWPLNIQYRSATGYGCPDTAPCDSQYYGLANQVDWAARMFRAIMNDAPDWYTPYNVGNNYIQYNPQASCGGSNVYIENRSTQALYNYTPYQPNKGALDAGWGSATCGAYGNRNFYLYFSSWFGRPNGNPYVSLEEPRWMQLRSQVAKYDLVTGQQTGTALPANTQLFFTDKIGLNDEIYVRTESDSAKGQQKGFRLADVQDIPYVAFDTPRKLTLTQSATKYAPHTEDSLKNQYLEKGLTPKFTSKIMVNGINYFRTEYDTLRNIPQGVPSSATAEIAFVEFDTPRYMNVATSTIKHDPVLGVDGAPVNANTHIMFDSKVYVDGTWHYRASSDTSEDSPMAISSANVKDIAYSRITPTVYETTEPLTKVTPRTDVTQSSTIAEGTKIRFTHRITVNGASYLMTEYDSIRGIDMAIDETKLSAVPPAQFTSISPTTIKVRTDGRKIDAELLNEVDPTLRSGAIITISSKILINGTTHYRTSYDTKHGLPKAIPESVFKSR